MRTIILQAACAAALLGVILSAPAARAYPSYDDGLGNGCVACHTGFQGGPGSLLHNNHVFGFGITQCNLCHPSGGGSTPVLTYWSGTGGGLGCAGCHGHAYGETSPNSGLPKATAYGLRQFHANQGVPVCATCHMPGALGHSNPFPPLFGENIAPPYFGQSTNNLTDPCDSAQEDRPSDVDTVGLDNDGDGAADWPADPDCPAPVTTTTTTSTTTTTLPFVCGAAPAGGCVAPTKGILLVHEKTPGKEKWKVVLSKLLPAVTPSQFGDPVSGTTAYKVCIYDGTNQLRGEFTVDRAGDTCGTKPCWSALSDKGYKYTDKALASDGTLKILGKGGDPTKGKVLALGKNTMSTMPLGLAALLAGQTSATAQVITSDAACFGVGFSVVKKADGLIFSAVGP